ncbi:MAG: acyl-[acyl-carrier-protein]--UDP-N-acetylglucosamine O-acyltransferase, partial [Candidatus Thiodiazotropha sp.]
MSIHPTAIVDTGAELGRNVSVGPHSIIGPHVVIGDD